MNGRAQRALSSVIGLALFLAALVVLWHQLSEVTWRALLADVAATPPKALLLALLLTSLSYITLSGYDFVAMAYIRKSLPRAHVGWVSFLAYAVANNVGFAALSGASVRYRFYTRWGLTAEDLSLVVLSNSVACWLGLLLLGGVSLVSAPNAVATLPWPRWTVPVGWLFIGVAVAYVLLVAIWRAPVRVRGFSVPSPRVRLALAQLTVSAVDWTLAAGGALRPPSAEPCDLPQRACGVSPGAASWSCQSYSRWHRRLRRAHRLRALAVPDPLAARAGARRLPRGLLRAAAVGGISRPGGR